MSSVSLPPVPVGTPPPPLPTRVRLKLKRIYLDLTGPRVDREWRRALSLASLVEGWLHTDEERWLFDAAYSLRSPGNIVEIGSFKGRSTCFLASGCRRTEKQVFAVDSFNGNDVDFGYRNFFAEFSQNVRRCGLSKYVQPIVGITSEVAGTWNKPIHFLFIDGSHTYEDVLADFKGFFPYVVPGATVAFHDVKNQNSPGVLQAWTEIKHQLTEIGFCQSLGYGKRPLCTDDRNSLGQSRGK